MWNLPYHLSRIWSGRLRGVPFGVLGVGAAALRSPSGRAMVRRSLSTARVVTVRDRPSLNALRRLGLSPLLAADPVLSLPVEVADADRLVVCLRPPVGQPGRFGRLLPAGSGPAEPGPVWVDAMAAALDQTATALGLTTRFVAMQRGRDDLVHQQVAETMRTPSEQAVPNLADVLTEVSRGQVVVAMRYHGGVAALAAGRPSVLIGYSPKVAALAADAAPAALLVGQPPQRLRGPPSFGPGCPRSHPRGRPRSRASTGAGNRQRPGNRPVARTDGWVRTLRRRRRRCGCGPGLVTGAERRRPVGAALRSRRTASPPPSRRLPSLPGFTPAQPPQVPRQRRGASPATEEAGRSQGTRVSPTRVPSRQDDGPGSDTPRSRSGRSAPGRGRRDPPLPGRTRTKWSRPGW